MSEDLDVADLLKLKELYSSGIGFGPTAIALINALEKERARVAKLEAALKELREYAASVWFDEASATDEEHELMRSSRAALKDAPQ